MLVSESQSLGPVVFPAFSGLRVMMMPFRVDDDSSLSETQVGGYKSMVFDMLSRRRAANGVGYLTIDEADVSAGETHRRPGLHVDGCGSYGSPKPYASGGMIIAANTCGTVAWSGVFDADAGKEGDCEHLRHLLGAAEAVKMADSNAYWCSPFCIHEAVAAPIGIRRQFVRVSYPSDAPYHRPYTRNITGVEPTSQPGQDRTGFMRYRGE